MNELSSPETRVALLSRAESYIATEPSFGRFLRAATLAADAEDLAAASAEQLEALFRKSYNRLGQRDSGAPTINIVAAETPGAPDIVELFSADMPFIVDSVLAAIRAHGGNVRFLTHPIVHFDPTTYRVLETETPGSRLESFLQVHIDALPDAAARQALATELRLTMADVGRAVADWKAMLQRVRLAVASWHNHPPDAPPGAVAEAMHFLGWLAEHNFTFLGMREYGLEGPGTLVPKPESGLGILADPAVLFLRTGSSYGEMTPEHAAFLAGPEPLLVTKANIRARVHRRAYLDYVGVKLYDEAGKPSGELRILGLYTSLSLATPNIEVPLIRRKVADVLKRAGLDPQSHAGKALTNVLDHYPRDELFQISTEQLFDFATTISGLADRPRVRVLPRIDRFDNFVSVLVYVPRDRYDSEVRARLGAYLAEIYDGHVSAFFPSFPEGDLVRVHFIIGRAGGPTPRPERERLEQDVTDLIRTFDDRLAAIAGRDDAANFGKAFPPAYEARYSAADALTDIEIIRLLPTGRDISLRLGKRPDGSLGLKLYHRASPLPLSDRVPLLENFGFRVIDEETHTITPATGPSIYLHDMLLDFAAEIDLEDGHRGEKLENAILAVWRGEAESDGLNALTTSVALSWDDVEVLRALTRYLRQIGIPYSRDYLIGVMARHPAVAAALVTLFHAANDPHFAGHRERAGLAAREVIAAAIEATTSLDEDRILRRYLNLTDAILRTNAYQRDGAGGRRPALALKFDCARIEALPEPHPYREIFVYAPRVEGLHLRFGPIARGGLRWSDRPEDFRTEVLGLVKAQQVKNAIIVPVGAKGAFVPRQLPPGGSREAVLAEATTCYQIFVSTLLDVTDNIEGDDIVPPPDVRRRDGDDPYLVVAADKGTASFSDTANALALDRDFWLGDAFASGGSAGYDHKEMGITARGAWEAVKRHFRERDRDIQTEPFTVAGVGDMSGDVFGNGMLLSPEIRLVAAFDHRDIFIDPNPDAARSFAERKRLFELPRSSWQDYDPALLSPGGGIYSRSLKTVPLAPEARTVLGLGDQPLSPVEVIRAILTAEIDLLWFGGIGTYVRSSSETDAAAGDKANDALRVTGAELRAQVVGEGANLGMTQLGRVEYALNGGRLNTDAIDNSAGVNSSDLEVNIKIALGTLVRSGKLTLPARNDFLKSMTDEVAALCLRNNYLQTLTLSVEQARGLSAFPEHLSLIDALEARGELQRQVEFLPEDAALRQRAVAGKGLTRPELAVLLAYAKNTLNEDLVQSAVPDDPYLGRELYRYFPERLCATFEESVTQHRLRREVIATVLANAMINRGGPAFVTELTGATSADAAQVAAAYAAARDSYGLTDLNRDLEALDGIIPGAAQLGLYARGQALLKRATLWFLRNGDFDQGLAPLVELYAGGIAEIRALLAEPLPPWLDQSLAAQTTQLQAIGIPAEMARRFAELPALSLGLDIVLVAQRNGTPVGETARAFFGVLELFGIGPVLEAGNGLVLADRFERMALDRALANLLRAQRDLTTDIVGFGSGEMPTRLAAWQAARPEAIARAAEAVKRLTEGDMTVSKLSVAAGLLADLARSA